MREGLLQNASGARAAARETRGLLPLAVRGLAFSAGGKRLIDNIDLSVSNSGITAVMGPNGAGKSLLVRLLHGLITPDAGEVLWNGIPASQETRARQAMVFQKPVLLRRSVAANLDFVLKLKGRTQPGLRDELLEKAGLASLSGQPARALSGGEQQRLAMARALACSLEVLFLDEPTASLDPASVQLIEGKISEARRTGVKVLLVTHDIGQARRLAHDVVFVHRGRVAEHTPASAFFSRPDSAPARDYLAGKIVL